MNIDFNFLKRSIGKTLKFEVRYTFEINKYFDDVFYATLNEVFDDYIIVEQFTVETDDNFENEKFKSVKRKLVRGCFSINNEIPLNA